jgi:HK97 family phage portal protein
MKIFGWSLTRNQEVQKDLSPPSSRGSWWPYVSESFSGAWQRNITLTADQAMSYHAVFACHTLICSDIAKLGLLLVAKKDGVWQEVTNPAYSPVLRKPNHFQNTPQFVAGWVNSKLARGNAYILKKRDGRGVVVGLYVLNPDRVQPLVSDDGEVFYQLDTDNISSLKENSVTVPAREIIHDRFNCLFHPLVGISPLYANALAATHGTNIQHAGANLAANGIRPSALITFPNRVPPEDAERIKNTWEAKYAGEAGASKLAVLGEGAKFEALTMTSDEAQLIEQLKYTAEVVCSTYHVPPYKIGLRDPTFNNVQALNVEYFSQCLQIHLREMEACLDEGLGMDGVTIGVMFDKDDLLWMDSLAQMEVLEKGRNYLTPNEGRQRLNLPKAEGGDVVLRQQQDFSLEALAKRDAAEDPFGTAKPEPVTPPEPANDDEGEREAARARSALLALSVREKLNARR